MCAGNNTEHLNQWNVHAPSVKRLSGHFRGMEVDRIGRDKRREGGRQEGKRKSWKGLKKKKKKTTTMMIC